MRINETTIRESEITNNKIPTVSSDKSVLANKFSPEKIIINDYIHMTLT
jgi:hypothetical protein